MEVVAHDLDNLRPKVMRNEKVENDTQSPLPKRLKEARARVGLSQRALGINIGFDPGSASGRMNHYEQGRHMPDYKTLKRLAEELGVPVAYLFCEDDEMAELVRLISKVDSQPRKEILALVRRRLGEE